MYTTTDGEEYLTPLMVAAKEGSLSVVQYLLSRQDVDVNVTTESRNSFAKRSWCKQKLWLKVLNFSRAKIDLNPGSPDYVKVDASHFALRAGHGAVAKALLEADEELLNDSSWTPLHVVAQTGHVDLFDLALKHTHGGVNVVGFDYRGRGGSTPLQEAVGYGKMAVVKVSLISH